MDDESLIIFSGGMPRASYSDKYTVSVIHGDKHVAFDFTSKVSVKKLVIFFVGSMTRRFLMECCFYSSLFFITFRVHCVVLVVSLML